MNPHNAFAKSPLRPAAFALAAGVAAAIAAGCSSHAAPGGAAMPPPPEVSVAQVLVKNVRQWDDFTGRVAAVQTVELRPRVSGYVDKVAYVEGREVGKGDLLFVIDQRPYRAQLAKAQADLARARSEAQLAQTQDARAQTLVTAKAISREEFDTRHAAVAQGNAAVRAAEAAVATAELDLQFTEVRSPIAGRTGRALVTIGNLARADETLLTTVVSMDPMYVDFEGDEQAYLRYADLAQGPARRAAQSGAGWPRQRGRVSARRHGRLHRQPIDSTTGTIHARAVLPNADRALTPGLFARVQLEGSAEFKAMLVDDKAVLTDQDRKYVYVLGPDNKAVRKDIVAGRVIDGLRVVDSGLDAQDAVIIRGMQKIFFPGMPVQPKTIAMDEGAAPAPEPVAMK